MSFRSPVRRTAIVIRSILHNLFVTAVGFVVALVGTRLDGLLGINEFRSTLWMVIVKHLIALLTSIIAQRSF